MKNYSRLLIISLFCIVSGYTTAQDKSIAVIDAHCHIKTTAQDTQLPTMEEYFMDNKSVNIQYLFGVTIARKGNIEQTMAQNDSLFAMAKRNSKFIPVCSVHPGDNDTAIKELERIKQNGGKIIKLHPLTQQFTIISEDVIRVVRKAGELGLVILIDGYGFVIPNYLEHLWQLAMICPQTNFIIAHMGGTDFYKLSGLHLVKKLNPEMFNNVWYDLSAVVTIYADSPYQAQFEWIIKKVGTDRILFGSDQPAATLSDALDAFYKLKLSDSEREQILYKNAKTLLHLE